MTLISERAQKQLDKNQFTFRFSAPNYVGLEVCLDLRPLKMGKLTSQNGSNLHSIGWTFAFGSTILTEAKNSKISAGGDICEGWRYPRNDS
jgi:hypothetical protein